MDMNLRRNNKKNKLILAVLLLIGIIGIGYAALGANLQINGIADITSATWNVHFVDDSINLTEGSVSITENTEEAAATIDSATEVSYHVKLTNPGDFYEFTVDVTNEGSIDAMIDSISSKIKIGDNEEVEIIPTGENRNLPSYLNYSVTYSDGVEIAAKQMLNSNATETFKVRVEFSTDIDEGDLPGTNQTLGLKFQVNYVQKDSTAIDVQHPLRSIGDDSWEDIIVNVQNGRGSLYEVGSTKEVDMGTLGTHTLRVANTTTPPECETEGFSQTACGFVLEFADIITTHYMNPSGGEYPYSDTGFSTGGWKNSSMRTYVNNTIYYILPEVLRNGIISTDVVSGYGSNDSTNFTTVDKLYLLSTHEVWNEVDESSDKRIDIYDTAYNNTRQLDYYMYNNVTTLNYYVASKTGTSDCYWWLRSAESNFSYVFSSVTTYGSRSMGDASNNDGVSPAFRLG